MSYDLNFLFLEIWGFMHPLLSNFICSSKMSHLFPFLKGVPPLKSHWGIGIRRPLPSFLVLSFQRFILQYIFNPSGLNFNFSEKSLFLSDVLLFRVRALLRNLSIFLSPSVSSKSLYISFAFTLYFLIHFDPPVISNLMSYFLIPLKLPRYFFA